MKKYLLSLLQALGMGHNERQRWLPGNVYPDDVFIVSYPRSGNTWVRFLIANLLKEPGEEIDFYSSNNYIPEVGRHNKVIENLGRPRVMKSHALYVAEYPKVIYVLRDGRDVYVSYYFYRLKKLPQKTSFLEFLGRPDHFPSLWGDHVMSWLYAKSPAPDIITVRYEDLVRDCFGQLRLMADFIGLPVSQDQLWSAVRAATFENMRRLEIERGRPYKAKGGVETFVRKGRIGGWTEFFGPEEKALFRCREGDVLIRLGYEEDENW